MSTLPPEPITDPRPFEATGPLPRGFNLLEASAGTGKTFTIAALATRYVAEGLPVDRLLVVTFTRAATGELRDRVRRRMVDARRALDQRLAGREGGGDTVDALLGSGTAEEVRARRDHLARALADFDRATIVTTHAFCDQVLQGLGTAGDVARDVTFLERPDDLLAEVVGDFYVRKFARQNRAPEVGFGQALQLARAVTATPGVDLAPREAPARSTPALRYRFATNVRAELLRRMHLENALGYDDILRSLAESLEPAEGLAVARLRDRFEVVLVDEFQDTDPVQWRILQRAFLAGEEASPGGGATLILVGDPKQAIYSFRGADVSAYLEAAARAPERRTLAVNWRSDPALLEGMDALLDGATLGHPQIRCRPSLAAGGPRRRLVGRAVPAPVRLRVLSGRDHRLERDMRGRPSTPSVQRAVAADLAADVVELLSSGTRLRGPGAGGPGDCGPGDCGPGDGGPGDDGEEERPLLPRDVAVLVRTNRGAVVARDALEGAGVPAVIHGSGSVFATAVAVQWLQLLEALERPSSTSRARAAALTDLVGWDATRLAAASEAEVGALQSQLHDWASVLGQQGVGALVEAITVATDLPSRVLARPDGERLLTDLHHIGELLHAEAVAGHLGAPALTAWVRRRIGEAEQADAGEELSRRLESDADAVQVLTIHRSKGLEFPVVYLPDLADDREQRGIPSFHDPRTGRRTVDVGGSDDPDNPDYGRHRQRADDERRGEELRQAYVALTRACQQVTVWWAPFRSHARSPLTRLLLSDRDPAGEMRPRPGADEDAVWARLAELSRRAPECLVAERASHPGEAHRFSPPATPAAADLQARVLRRGLDTAWRRTSFTALTVAAHEASGSSQVETAVGSEAEEPWLDDEIPVETPVDVAVEVPAELPSEVGRAGRRATDEAGEDASEEDLRAVPSPMAGLERGPAFGVLVHAVLQASAFDSPDLLSELGAQVEDSGRFARLGPASPGLAGALAAVIDTPLGPSVDDLRLRDLARRDRLDELAFELPLVGGEAPEGRLSLHHLAELLRRWIAPGEPLAGYAERLDDVAPDQVLRGYLTGSVDLLLRVRSRPADRYVVVDYKTNWLGPPGEPLSAWHYRPAALADAMAQAHYPLQALLYSVALHRYLRWRLPGYRPERDLGGILYLFVRGMAGVGTPRVGGQPCGVFAWSPPSGLISELSDLLDRGRP